MVCEWFETCTGIEFAIEDADEHDVASLGADSAVAEDEVRTGGGDEDGDLFELESGLDPNPESQSTLGNFFLGVVPWGWWAAETVELFPDIAVDCWLLLACEEMIGVINSLSEESGSSYNTFEKKHKKKLIKKNHNLTI